MKWFNRFFALLWLVMIFFDAPKVWEIDKMTAISLALGYIAIAIFLVTDPSSVKVQK